MTQEQILEGNKLIAEFMGATYQPEIKNRCWFPTNQPMKIYEFNEQNQGMSGYYGLEEMGYHSSWDWQIPVWEKIGHLMQQYVSKDEVPISAMQEYNRLCDKYESAVFTNNPQKGFQTLLESITWYNAQKQS